MLNRSDSEHIASNYFRKKRTSPLFAGEPSKSLATGNGPSHPTTSGSSITPEGLLPRPFRLESLGILPVSGKAKRKKNKTQILCDGN